MTMSVCMLSYGCVVDVYIFFGEDGVSRKAFKFILCCVYIFETRICISLYNINEPFSSYKLYFYKMVE